MLVFFLLFNTLYLAPNILKTQDKEKYDKFETLFADLKTDKILALLFNSFFILRRILMALVLVYLIEQPVIQTWFLMVMSFAQFIYLLKVKPFEDSMTNKVEIMNEIFFLIAIYHMYVFSDML